MVQKKILIVDDDPDVRLGLQLRLTANHYDVIAAGDGVASIAEARKHAPDLMILDLELPAGDGFSVLERLKVNERLSSIPALSDTPPANVLLEQSGALGAPPH